MRAEKQVISAEYLAWLKRPPFFMVVDYPGLKVGPITELRKRLKKAGAEMQVVKNSLFRLAAKEVGADLAGGLIGQVAVITGERDLSVAATVAQPFQPASHTPTFPLRFSTTP